MRYFWIHTFITELLIAWLLPAYYSKIRLKLHFNWRKKRELYFLILLIPTSDVAGQLLPKIGKAQFLQSATFATTAIAKVLYAVIFHFETVQKLHSRTLNLLQSNCVALSTFFLVNCTILYMVLNFVSFQSEYWQKSASLADCFLLFVNYCNCKNAKHALYFVDLIVEAKLRFDLVAKFHSTFAEIA